MKKKVLACVLACAMLILGMGYAYWTDSLQIDTSVTTGELEVKFVDLALYGQYAGTDNEKTWAIIDGVGSPGYVDNYFFDRGNENNANGLYNIIATPAKLNEYKNRVEGYTKTEFNAWLDDPIKLDVTVGPYGTNTDSSSTIKIDLKKMYPGYAQVFQSDIVNIGTVAAKLSDIKITGIDVPNDYMKDIIGVSLRVLREYAETPAGPTQDHVNVFSTAALLPTDYFTLGGVDFIRLSALEELDLGAVIDENGELLYVLPDKNRMDVYLGIAMDPDMEGNYTSGISSDPSDVSDYWTENQTGVRFSLNFLWDQFNVGNPNGGTHNHLE